MSRLNEFGVFFSFFKVESKKSCCVKWQKRGGVSKRHLAVSGKKK